MLFLNLQILVQKEDFPARCFLNQQATEPKPMDLNLFCHKYDWIGITWAPLEPLQCPNVAKNPLNVGKFWWNVLKSGISQIRGLHMVI